MLKPRCIQKKIRSIIFGPWTFWTELKSTVLICLQNFCGMVKDYINTIHIQSKCHRNSFICIRITISLTHPWILIKLYASRQSSQYPKPQNINIQSASHTNMASFLNQTIHRVTDKKPNGTNSKLMQIKY